MSASVASAFLLFEGQLNAMLAGSPAAPAQPVVAAWLFGTLVGMRHALEPDHLAAVATLVSEGGRKKNPSILGAFWGLGHTLSLLVVGGLLFALRTPMPAWLEGALELIVALMLVSLGAAGLQKAFRGVSVTAEHTHRPMWHRGRRPLVVGLVHGLAGSGALTVLVMAEMPTASAALVFMGLFGLGSALTMAMVTGLVGGSVSSITKHPKTTAWVRAVTAVASVMVGLLWGYESLVGLVG